jgi:hypothetical protein
MKYNTSQTSCRAPTLPCLIWCHGFLRSVFNHVHLCSLYCVFHARAHGSPARVPYVDCPSACVGDQNVVLLRTGAGLEQGPQNFYSRVYRPVS